MEECDGTLSLSTCAHNSWSQTLRTELRESMKPKFFTWVAGPRCFRHLYCVPGSTLSGSWSRTWTWVGIPKYLGQTSARIVYPRRVHKTSRVPSAYFHTVRISSSGFFFSYSYQGNPFVYSDQN